MSLRAWGAICLSACALLGGCVANTSGDPEDEAPSSETLGNDDTAPPAPRLEKLAPGQGAAANSHEAPGVDRSDPDPEPWHGGQAATPSAGGGKHD